MLGGRLQPGRAVLLCQSLELAFVRQHVFFQRQLEEVDDMHEVQGGPGKLGNLDGLFQREVSVIAFVD